MTQGNDSAYGYGFTTADGSSHVDSIGLSKREYFAAMAMQGLLSSIGQHDVTDYSEISSDSVMAADALINALNQTK